MKVLKGLIVVLVIIALLLGSARYLKGKYEGLRALDYLEELNGGETIALEYNMDMSLFIYLDYRIGYVFGSENETDREKFVFFLFNERITIPVYADQCIGFLEVEDILIDHGYKQHGWSEIDIRSTYNLEDDADLTEFKNYLYFTGKTQSGKTYEINFVDGQLNIME